MLIRVIVSVFFKEIYIIGEENIPKEGPLIISGTHNNQFMDAAMLLVAIKREINFVIAASSAKLKTLGIFLRFLNIIPTERPIDKKYRGKGYIENFEDDILIGKDTSFTTQLNRGFAIKLENSDVELSVEEVISDTKLRLASKFEEKLEGKRNYEILPKINQEVVFKNVFETLNKDRCVGIFPEGGSHDRTQLLPLKAGACVFVWGSYNLYNRKVQMVECGINYFGAHKFRSKVVINIGKPRSYDFDREKMNDREYKKETIDSMLHDLKESMEQVKITAPSYNELVNLYCAKEIYIPENIQLNADKDFKLFHKFSTAYKKIKDFPEVQELVKEVDLFRKKTKKLGLKVSEIRNFKIIFGDDTLIHIKKLLLLLVLVS